MCASYSFVLILSLIFTYIFRLHVACPLRGFRLHTNRAHNYTAIYVCCCCCCFGRTTERHVRVDTVRENQNFFKVSEQSVINSVSSKENTKFYLKVSEKSGNFEKEFPRWQRECFFQKTFTKGTYFCGLDAGFIGKEFVFYGQGIFIIVISGDPVSTYGLIAQKESQNNMRWNLLRGLLKFVLGPINRL